MVFSSSPPSSAAPPTPQEIQRKLSVHNTTRPPKVRRSSHHPSIHHSTKANLLSLHSQHPPSHLPIFTQAPNQTASNIPNTSHPAPQVSASAPPPAPSTTSVYQALQVHPYRCRIPVRYKPVAAMVPPRRRATQLGKNARRALALLFLHPMPRSHKPHRRHLPRLLSPSRCPSSSNRRRWSLLRRNALLSAEGRIAMRRTMMRWVGGRVLVRVQVRRLRVPVV